MLTAEADSAFSQYSGASEAIYNVTVKQLAKAQENTGLALAKDAETGVNVGTNTFAVNIGGQAHEITIDVASGDTNETVLGKMVSAINNAGIGVTAKVAAGSDEGSQQLVITADETGTGQAFSISDLSGNAVGSAGIDTVSTVAQDARYAVDGTDHTSETNTVYLDGGFVTATLMGTGEATLTIAPDPGKVENAATSLVSEVNSFVDFLESNKDYIHDEVLATVNGFISDHKKELEAMGITEEDDGRFVVNTDKLTSAVADNLAGVQEVFGGLDGVAIQLKNYASTVATDSPLNYAKEAEAMGADFADYFHGTSASMLQDMLQGALLNTFV